GNPGAANDNGAGGKDDPTLIRLPARPRLIKAMTALPAALPNGHYGVTYQLTMENAGGSELCQLALEEDLAGHLGCAFVGVLNITAPIFAINGGSSTLPSLNSLYDGSTYTNLLNNDGCLYPGDRLVVFITIEIDPACTGVPQPMANTATFSGTDTDGLPQSDDSDDGTDLDGVPGPDNETGNDNDPTLLVVPQISLVKQQTASELLPNGNFLVTYILVVKNTGNEILENIAVEDDLATQFNPAFVQASVVSVSGTANNPGGLHPGYTGSGTTGSPAPDGDDLLNRTGTLKPGETIMAEISLEINPTLVPGAGLFNQATATATTPDGDTVTDLSDNGSDPGTPNGSGGSDDPSPLDLGPVPALTKAVNDLPVLLPNGHYLVRYDFTIRNNGAGEMCQIDLLDNLASQMGCAFVSTTTAQLISWDNASGNSTQPGFNTAFNGSTSDNLLTGNGCIQPGDGIAFYIEVELDLSCGNVPAPLTNLASLAVVDANGHPFTDESDDATDLDSNGTPDNDSGGEGDPTIVHLPGVGISKALIGSTALTNGNILLDFQFNIHNTGNTTLSNLSISDALDFSPAVVGSPSVVVVNMSATSPPAAHPAYDGITHIDLLAGASANRLHPGQSFKVLLSVEIDPLVLGLLPQPVENQAVVTANPIYATGGPIAGYGPVTDASDDGTGLPDGGDPATGNPGADNDNGAGGPDDPTMVYVPPTPRLSKAMTGAPIALPNGHFAVTYQFELRNEGGSAFCHLSLEEDFATQFGCAFSGVIGISSPVLTNVSGNSIPPTLSAQYNGSTHIDLLNSDGCLFPGDVITLSVTAEVDINCPNRPDPLANVATLSGTTDDGTEVSDVSDDSTDLDNDNTPDNETGNPNDPSLLRIPDLALTKALVQRTTLANGNFELTFRFNVQNTGNVNLSNLRLNDPLPFAAALAGAPDITVVNVDATSAPVPNLLYNGNGVIDLVNGSLSDLLQPGQSF
ncbi:MAG TPA: hypothetical protein ENJ20_07665, partial [Bacteroidetes bacterium]|nr:hypothetical protein [Bacteroidota bacterium]